MFSNLVFATRFVALAALCLFGFYISPAQMPTAGQIAAKADEYLKAAAEVNRFSGSVLVARNGQTIFSKGYGMANYELDVPNTARTIFRVGSLTKPFTATAILMLAERGKLNTGDSVCKHLPDCPAAWQTVTIRHLLSHTSGIPTQTTLAAYEKSSALPIDRAGTIGLIKNLPLESAPGEKFNYNNSGYYLLGLIIERASGKSYHDFLRENIFQPLGMTATALDDNSSLVKNRASGYFDAGDGFRNAAFVHMSRPFAAGALRSNTEDLLRFEQALDGEKLISRRSLAEMYTPHKEIFPGVGYALGWGIGEQVGRRAILHAGHIEGFANFMIRFPAERVSIIVLNNNRRAPVEQIGYDLAALVFGAEYKIPKARQAVAISAKTLEKYVGQYKPEQGSVITVTLENGRLFRQIGQQPKVEIFAASETEFFLKGNDLYLKFVTNAEGRVTGQLMRRGASETVAPKIK